MSDTTIQVDTEGFCLDGFHQKSIQMENPLSTTNGRGTVYYEKDGKSYTLMVTFVNGKKEGKGILVDGDYEVVGKVNFVDDKVIDDSRRDERNVNEVNEELKRKLKGSGKSKKLKIVNGKKRWNWWIMLWIVVGLIGMIVGYELVWYVIMMIRGSGNVVIHNYEEYRHLPSFVHSNIRNLEFSEGACVSVSSLSLSSFVNCESVVIKENALMNVRWVEAKGLKRLKKIEVGLGCLLNVDK